MVKVKVKVKVKVVVAVVVVVEPRSATRRADAGSKIMNMKNWSGRLCGHSRRWPKWSVQSLSLH